MAEINDQAGLWGNIFDGIFWGVSKFRGRHWELAEEELTEMAEKTAEAINRNLPEGWLQQYNERLKQGSPIVAAVAVTGAVIYDRIEKDRAIALAKKNGRGGAGVGPGYTDYPSRPMPQVHNAETDGEEDTGRDSEGV